MGWGPARASFSRGHGSSASFSQSECGRFITEAHIGQREIANPSLIFRLFFEERFQFSPRLLPTFLRGRMVAGNFLRAV
jgi:hypothetical protein